MNKDLSSCCKKEKIKPGATPEPIKSNALQPARNRKRTASSSSSITPPPFKKNGGIDGSAVLPQLLITDQAATAKSQAEVVCTPDILSMFEQDAPQPRDQPPALVRHYAPSYQHQQQKQQQQLLLQQQQRQTVIAPPVPIQPKRPAGPLSARSLSIQAPATTAPVYHRINGFKVDLNIAAQQETYRLPNGKLIQVKKQTPALVPTSNPRPGPPQPPVRPVLHNRNLPAAPTLLSVRYNNVNPVNVNAVINNVSQNFVPPKPSNHGNSPLGQARTMFEGKVFASMDVCKHIMGKIQALTNSTAYKTVKSYNDLKELHIHLSYLFTYAIGRFKTLQDTGTEDMKKLGLVIDATNAALNDNSDDDDLQIIEPHTTLIELDSDGEDTLRVIPPVPALTQIMQLPAGVTVTKKMVSVPKPSPTPSNTSITEMEIPMPEMLYDDEKLKMNVRVMLTKCDDSSVSNMKRKLKKLLDNDKENINEEEVVAEKVLNGRSDKVCDAEVVEGGEKVIEEIVEKEKVEEENKEKDSEENVEKESEKNETIKDYEKPLDETVDAEAIEKMDTSEIGVTETPESMEVDEEAASNNSSSKEECEESVSAATLPIVDDLQDKEKVIDENGDTEKDVKIDEKKEDEEEEVEKNQEDKEIEADDEISTKDDEETSEETSQDSKSTQDDEKTETEHTSEDSSSLESSDKLIENVKPVLALGDIIASGLNELIPNKSLTSNT